ncbi:MAG: hypothetical protein ACI8ZN_000339 [Bacteroidia bacterium]|jgi:hypothetical protein
MKFQKDDQVGLLNSVGSGRVIHVLEPDRYLVFIEDFDMEMPLHESELYLIDTSEIHVISLANRSSEKAVKTNQHKVGSAVIDLHFNSIPASFKQNTNMLEAQFSFFEISIKNAQIKGESSLTFIHGKGDGVLRNRMVIHLRSFMLKFEDPERVLNRKGASLRVILK